MAAYIIAIRERTTDAEALAAYAAGAAKARTPALRALAAYGACETLEGPDVEGVVLLEFPDMAAAHEWYDSPAYQAAREHRLKGGDYRFVLFEGI